MIKESKKKNAEIIYGQMYDDSLGESVRVTVVAAGYGQRPNRPDAGIGVDPEGPEGGDLPGFIQG